MRTIILSVFLILISIKVSAQNSDFQKEKAKSYLENQIEFLNLDEEKEILFKEINDKYQLKLERIKNRNNDRFAKFRDLKKLMNEKEPGTTLRLIIQKQYQIKNLLSSKPSTQGEKLKQIFCPTALKLQQLIKTRMISPLPVLWSKVAQCHLCLQ